MDHPVALRNADRLANNTIKPPTSTLLPSSRRARPSWRGTGFVESREILAHCRASGAQAVVGSQYEGALGVWASIAFAASSAELCQQPAEVGNFLDLANDLVPGPEIVDGRAAVRPKPGLGIMLDPDALAHYRMDS
jgi:L-alanine-DL-glutamate epimerase-like enolase superfamily enzyme